jgi:hypothetical protein
MVAPSPMARLKMAGSTLLARQMRSAILMVAMAVRPFGSDGEAVELAGQSDSEVADVDHLLHFAFAFSEDLASFECDEAPQVVLGITQGVAELAEDLAAFGGGDKLPFLEGYLGAAGGAFEFFLTGGADGGEDATVNGRKARQRLAAAQPLAAEDAGVVRAQA